MFDELQKDYYSNNMRWEIAHIPVAADFEYSAIIFEYLNYTSHQIVNPAYFETVLSTQAVQVPEDAEMLRLVRNNVRFDFATFYQTQLGSDYANNLYQGVVSLIRRGDADIASFWKANVGSYETLLEDLTDTYLYYLDEE